MQPNPKPFSRSKIRTNINWFRLTLLNFFETIIRVLSRAYKSIFQKKSYLKGAGITVILIGCLIKYFSETESGFYHYHDAAIIAADVSPNGEYSAVSYSNGHFEVRNSWTQERLGDPFNDAIDRITFIKIDSFTPQGDDRIIAITSDGQILVKSLPDMTDLLLPGSLPKSIHTPVLNLNPQNGDIWAAGIRYSINENDIEYWKAKITIKDQISITDSTQNTAELLSDKIVPLWQVIDTDILPDTKRSPDVKSIDAAGQITWQGVVAPKSFCEDAFVSWSRQDLIYRISPTQGFCETRDGINSNLDINSENISTAAFLQQGNLPYALVGTTEGQVNMVDLENRNIVTKKIIHDQAISSIAITKNNLEALIGTIDGHLFRVNLSIGNFDSNTEKSNKLIDFHTIAQLDGHGAPISHILISQDDTTALAASENGTLQFLQYDRPNIFGRINRLFLILGERLKSHKERVFIDIVPVKKRVDTIQEPLTQELPTEQLATKLPDLICTQNLRQEIIYFEYDRSSSPETTDALKRLLFYEDENCEIKSIRVVGHTESEGSAEYNLEISKRRADSVHDEILRLGIDPTLITIEGKGETELFVPTGDGVREQLNRRVEVLLELQ